MGNDVAPGDLFPGDQIRLAEVSVYNWGTFAGCHTARIHAEGTLITGDTGAGKSSFIDATQLLYLQRNKAVFNTAAAQGAKDDRSLLSYVRGKYKHDEVESGTGYGGYSRRHSTASAVRGLYRCGEKEFTLIALFWVTGATTAQKDITNLYIIADANLALPEVLQHLGKLDKRALKLAYRDRAEVTFYDDFEGYRVKSQDKLFFENPNAPGLLTRALGLKKIEDLTHLIQNFVLDAGDIRQTAAAAVRGFRDLETVHSQLLDTRDRAQYLKDLPALRDRLNAARQEIERLEQARLALPIYLAREWLRLLSNRLSRQLLDHTSKRLALEQTQAAKATADAHWEAMHRLYVEAGGGAIEKLEAQHEAAMQELHRVQGAARQYIALAAAVGLPALTTPEAFASTQQIVQSELANESATKDALLNEVVRTEQVRTNASDDVTALDRELRSAQSRKDSAVPDEYAIRRNQLADDLGIVRDRLMFVAELIDVLPEEDGWRGAIERAIKVKLTLAVPEDDVRRVTRWANSRHLGIRFKFQPVTRMPERTVFKADSYLRKLSWRDHPYRDWAKMLLSHRDLRCVESPEECETNPFSLTREGLIQWKKGDFEKDDRRRVDDDHEWVIGYTNVGRIQRLQRQLIDKRTVCEAAERSSLTARERHRAFDTRAHQLKTLQSVSWAAIDVDAAQRQIGHLQQALDRSRSAGTALAKAKANLDDAKEARARAEGELFAARNAESAAATALKVSQEGEARFKPIARAGLTEEALQVASHLAGVRSDTDLDSIKAVEAQAELRLEEALRQAKDNRSAAHSEATGIISGFYQKWLPIAAEWRANTDSINDYVQHHDEIVSKGLPELVNRFTEMLTKHSTQSLAAVTQQIKNERENIQDRIEAINGVLKRTEFRRNTYLQIEARPGNYPLNEEYVRKVNQALALVTSADHEKRYAALKEPIDILAKATDPMFSSSKENTRLLDPRFQFEFVAKEYAQGKAEAVDTWGSSMSKSGGEKESFAGTIMAASLAYVLTPAGSDKPIFCTVFLDEAFSNTSAVYSRRVLKTFRELKLHLNLITPFKNIELARDCARLLVLVRKDESLDQHQSSLSEITWEYIDQKIRQRAVAAGITVEPDA